MMVYENNDSYEYEKQIHELQEQVTTLEKTTNELNEKLNQKDAYLKVAYMDIFLLSVLSIALIVFMIVKKIRNGK